MMEKIKWFDFWIDSCTSSVCWALYFGVGVVLYKSPIATIGNFVFVGFLFAFTWFTWFTWFCLLSLITIFFSKDIYYLFMLVLICKLFWVNCSYILYNRV